MKKGYKKCPYCAEEIRKNAKKCRHCHELLDEDIRSKKKDEKKDEKKYKCNGCGKIINLGDKKCPECGNNLVLGDINKKCNNFRRWEELTLEEQKYISEKLSGWKIFTVFLTQWGLIWCKRWGDLSWYLVIGLILILTLPPLGFVFCIIARIIILSNFSKEAYNHDMPYFQKYLDEYAELHKNGYDKDGYDENGFDKNGDHYNGICHIYKCKKCGNSIKEGVKNCPHCGVEIIRRRKNIVKDVLKSKRKFIFLLILVTIYLIILAVRS